MMMQFEIVSSEETDDNFINKNSNKLNNSKYDLPKQIIDAYFLQGIETLYDWQVILLIKERMLAIDRCFDW